MLCEEIRGLFSEYIDGELGWVKKRRVRAHLRSCVSCAKEFQALVQTLMNIREYPEVVPSADFASSILSRMPSQQPVVVRRRYPVIVIELGSVLKVGLAVLGCILMVFFGSMAVTSGYKETKPAKSLTRQVNQLSTLSKSMGWELFELEEKGE